MLVRKEDHKHLQNRVARIERGQKNAGATNVTTSAGTFVGAIGSGKRGNAVTESTPPTQNTGFSVFPALITGVSSLGSNQWRYSFALAKKPLPNGHVSSWMPSQDISGIAYNMAEHINNGNGLEGNGVDVNNLLEGWAYQPVPAMSVVMMIQVVCSNGDKEYWFQFENAIDGVCEEET
jgi:hypothetical protein